MRISAGICCQICHAKNYPLLYKLGKHFDDWGPFGMLPKRAGAAYRRIPIKPDLSDYNDYKWPEVFTAGVPQYRLYSGHKVGKSDDYYARGGWIVFFEQMQQLFGFENLLIALLMEMPEVYRLRDDLLRFNLAWLEQLACI